MSYVLTALLVAGMPWFTEDANAEVFKTSRSKDTATKTKRSIDNDADTAAGATEKDEEEELDAKRPRGASASTPEEGEVRDDDLDQNLEEVAVPKRPKARHTVGNEFYFRAGMARVVARVEAGPLQLEPVGIAQLAPMEPVQGIIEPESTNAIAAIIGFAPKLFRGYVAFETLIGIPKKAKLRLKGDLANKSLAPSAAGIDTGIPPLGEELAQAGGGPPMLTVVLRLPALGPLHAYVGGGVSVLIARDVRITNKVLSEVATPKVEIDPALGVVVQAGIDINVWRRYYARFDFKELWFEGTETRISNLRVKTTIPLLETIEVGSGKSISKANPIIVQFGVGANF